MASVETIERVRRKELPKGDALALAEAAGVMAAKRTSDMLPLCHPLSLDSVRVWCTVEKTSVLVGCEAIATAKTGVEMEALTGVNAALLCIYDLTKAIDPALSISDVHLDLKEGGKSGVWKHPQDFKVFSDEKDLEGLRVGRVTISDRCSQGKAQDSSGTLLDEILSSLGAKVAQTAIIPDEVSAIQTEIKKLVFDQRLDLVITTGGTGISPRDVTPEAILSLGGKIIPGIGELLRNKGAQYTPMAWLSRSEAVLLRNTLVIILPGNPKAVQEGMMVLRSILSHAFHIIAGGRHE